MIEIEGKKFFDAYTQAISLATMVIWNTEKASKPSLPPATYEIAKQQMAVLFEQLQRLDLPVSAVAAQTALESLSRARFDQGEWRFDQQGISILQGQLEALATRVPDEMSTRLVLAIPSNKRGFYQSSSPLFGGAVNSSFPSAIVEIDEAGKCLALSRNAACVFHLMRIVEIGLGAVHACLGIQVALIGNDRNWGSILNRVRDEIRTRGSKWAEHDLFQEIHVQLVAVKDAWRNATMHVETKYTEEDAQRIFEAVRGLMMKLASRLDEQGQPPV
jgi:hypothetical protein